MAIPVLAGIPWLAGLIGGLFTALFSYFAKYLSKRFAVTVTVVSILVTVSAAFFVAINALIGGIVVAAPPEVAAVAGMILPSNTEACLTAIATAQLLKWAYVWNVKVIQYKLF